MDAIAANALPRFAVFPATGNRESSPLSVAGDSEESDIVPELRRINFVECVCFAMVPVEIVFSGCMRA
jgi:hypothetical protein